MPGRWITVHGRAVYIEDNRGKKKGSRVVVKKDDAALLRGQPSSQLHTDEKIKVTQGDRERTFTNRAAAEKYAQKLYDANPDKPPLIWGSSGGRPYNPKAKQFRRDRQRAVRRQNQREGFQPRGHHASRGD